MWTSQDYFFKLYYRGALDVPLSCVYIWFRTFVIKGAGREDSVTNYAKTKVVFLSVNWRILINSKKLQDFLHCPQASLPSEGQAFPASPALAEGHVRLRWDPDTWKALWLTTKHASQMRNHLPVVQKLAEQTRKRLGVCWMKRRFK